MLPAMELLLLALFSPTVGEENRWVIGLRIDDRD
jgi:hypothetical protein